MCIYKDGNQKSFINTTNFHLHLNFYSQLNQINIFLNTKLFLWYITDPPRSNKIVEL